MITKSQLAKLIDHTNLNPEATTQHIRLLCDEALKYQVASVCVSPTRVGLAVGQLDGNIPVCTVIGFPSGAVVTDAKCEELREAKLQGAQEFDMVINIGALKDGDVDAVYGEIARLKEIAGPLPLKTILETAVLSDEEIVAACEAAVRAGADFVKTSTGFHKAGGATVHAVRLMKETVGPRVGVKASGGIRTFDAAQQMVDAGASRIGLSQTAAVLADL